MSSRPTLTLKLWMNSLPHPLFEQSDPVLTSSFLDRNFPNKFVQQNEATVSSSDLTLAVKTQSILEQAFVEPLATFIKNPSYSFDPPASFSSQVFIVSSFLLFPALKLLTAQTLPVRVGRSLCTQCHWLFHLTSVGFMKSCSLPRPFLLRSL